MACSTLLEAGSSDGGSVDCSLSKLQATVDAPEVGAVQSFEVGHFPSDSALPRSVRAFGYSQHSVSPRSDPPSGL
jgi:hypothetical protein